MMNLFRKIGGKWYIRGLVGYTIDSMAFEESKRLWKEGRAVHVERVDEFWYVWRSL